MRKIPGLGWMSDWRDSILVGCRTGGKYLAGGISGIVRTVACNKNGYVMYRTASGLASRSVKPCVRRSERMSVQAAGFVEVAQLAGEQAEIFGPAAVVFACTLVVSAWIGWVEHELFDLLWG